MRRLWGALLSVFTGCAVAVSATAETGKWSQIGYGRLVVNDVIGDGQDRWRTGSVASSRIFGRGWDGSLPTTAGEVLEFRFLGEIMAPSNLSTPSATDRPYAGSLSFGMHTHFRSRGLQVSLGGDLSVVGPQTRLDELQSGLHDFFGFVEPSAAVKAGQVGNQVVPTLNFEIGRDVALTGAMTLRPFVAGQAGTETLLRIGADLTIGAVGQGELLVRDPVTGHRYRTIKNPVPGFSWVVGGDVAKVHDSIYLPGSGGYTLTDARSRLRAGVHWQGRENTVFYGLTWLGEEFSAQSEGQLVGAVRVDVKF
ncbi:hypothetical protein SAMN04490248_11252 [Salinihabitans flavidus]|uniref:DUF2219 domain-containing protein n=1 Tax=Salinihabitans flavidus TaxID=569882 RepID=A0A1H8SIQ8_9RHOB|nr:lipid A-modifier LpxR family protein [Salinihabitans flavidus]SEO78447.1 hypothetical protein SAMN04490248_11252 [Salinihabitans flavidus]